MITGMMMHQCQVVVCVGYVWTGTGYNDNYSVLCLNLDMYESAGLLKFCSNQYRR